MSLYDNLANSDFVNPGEFKKHLNQLSHLQESQDSGLQDTVQPKAPGLNASDFDPKANPLEGSLEDKVNLGENDSLQRPAQPSQPHGMGSSYLSQKEDIGQLQSQISQLRDQADRLNFLQQERTKFENKTKLRESIGEDDLFGQANLQQITDQNAAHLGPSKPQKIDDQRNKLIFEGDLDMSEREIKRENPYANQGARQDTLVPQDLKKDSLKSDPYNTLSQVQQPSSNFGQRSNLEGQPDGQFTLNQYESKPELLKNRERTHTNQTQRTENPDKELFLLDQRGLDDEGTGQFGGGRAAHKWEEADRESRRNVQVDQFQPGVAPKESTSPKVGGNKGDHISQLLAQLQAPMSLNPVPEKQVEASIDKISSSQLDIDRAHRQMQDSLKQRQDDKVMGAQGFNGQNSIYEVAQKMGQPLSGVQSISENEPDFNRFMQGDGSLNSASGYQQFAMKSHGEDPGRSGLSGKYNPNIQTNAIEQANQLLMQMQGGPSAADRPTMLKRRASNSGVGANDKVFQNAAQNVFFNEKENVNGRNMGYDEPPLNSASTMNQAPPQAPAGPPKMSLAARANQAKLQRGQTNTNYRQKFDPAQFLNQQQPPANPPPSNYPPQYPQHQQHPQHQKTMPVAPQQPRMPYEGQNVDFSKTNQNDKIQKRQALLAQFDDIPIHQLHKADGYQIRNLDDEMAMEPKNPVEVDAELQKLDLKDRAFHPKWKVRCAAYKEITQALLAYQPPKELQREEEMYGLPENPFDIYGPIMEQMIKDTNLIAQYEALTSLYAFIAHGQDIKSVTFTCNSYLLDKIQHVKPNFREITQKILLEMLSRGQNIVPELLKRFSSRNQKIIGFCTEVLNEALSTQRMDSHDLNLKLIFKSSHQLLAHNVKQIRDVTHDIMLYVWENCEDDLDTFCSHLTALRPVQLNEMTALLSSHEKNRNAEYLVKLFDKAAEKGEHKKEGDRSLPRSKSQESIGERHDKPEPAHKPVASEDEVDLTHITPDNFSEIPHMTQINVKRRVLDGFNKELEKLVEKQMELDESVAPEKDGSSGSVVRLTKDYSSIYNVLQHILEDPNALVFIEGIKMVGSLAVLLKSTMKQSKMKQFLNLIADKYKETKTAVLQALEKTISLIFEHKCLSATAFFELLINNIAATHKNPRVKQMVIDRVEIVIDSFFIDHAAQVGINNPQLASVFKGTKTKLKQIILKDTSNSVRDAGVSLLAKFRCILGSNCLISEYQEVVEIIDALPKQRQTEIHKRVDAFEEQPERMKFREQAKEGQQLTHDFEAEQESKPTLEEQKSKASDRASHHNISMSNNSDVGISRQYQASLSDIIMTIKNISQDGDRLRPNQISQNLEDGLHEIGEEGIRECKSSIVTCVYWLLSQYPQRRSFLDPQREEAIKALVHFLVRLFTIDPHVVIHMNEQSQLKESVQLQQTVSVAVIGFALYGVQEPSLVQLLSMMYKIGLSCGFPTVQFLAVLKQAMLKFEPKPSSLPCGQTLVLSNVLYFISDRIGEFIQKSQTEGNLNQSLQLQDFTDFHNLVLSQINFARSEQDKQILIQAIEYLKAQMQTHKERQLHSMRQDSTPDQMPREQSVVKVQPIEMQDQMQYSESKIPRYQQVLEAIQDNFEQGLLKLKEFVKDEQNGTLDVSFDQKESIVVLLLDLTTKGFKAQSEQYKQAYSLKALMWLKEEFIGMEETFKLTNPVMDAFVSAVLDGRDSSIEQYLLVNWTKSLSLRDIIDRVAISCRFSSNKAEAFTCLLNWILKNKLDSNWALEDFRKIILFVAQNILANDQGGAASKFLDHAVEKFTSSRVRDFIEIQLIQENQVLMKFLDYFDGKYGQQQDESHIKIAKNNNDSSFAANTSSQRREGDISLQEPLLTGRSNGGTTERSQRLQEMRDRRKESKQEDIQSTLAEERKKYEEIMDRLEKYKSSRQGGRDTQQETLNEPLKGERIINPHHDQQRVSATSKGRLQEDEGHTLNTDAIRKAKDIDSRPISEHNTRYNEKKEPAQPMGRNKHSGSLGGGFLPHEGTTTNSIGFNDEEDFKLSTDNHHSVAYLGSNANHNSSRPGLQSKPGSEIQKHPDQSLKNPLGSNSMKVFGEGLNNQSEYEQQTEKKGAYEIELQESRQKLKESVQYQEEKMLRLQSSQIKVRQFKNDLDQLEHEKRKLEAEKEQLLQEQNKESEQWKKRYQEMTEKNDEVVASLAEANRCYFRQVSENEKMVKQIQQLQDQHAELVDKYGQMESRLQDSQKQIEEQKQRLQEEANRPQTPSNAQIVEETQIQKVADAFDRQVMSYGESLGQIGVKKIQELLLDSESGSKLGKPLIFHYQKMKIKSDRMQMMASLKQALDNEDVLFAVNADVYKSLLNFLLNAFSFEKQLIERESLQQTHEREQQNELTQESQRLVSKLLNSKEFTTSLVCLIQLLKLQAIPDDFSQQLTVQEVHFLRVIVRCISRITKALHSENPDLIRAFDVLVEMHKLFQQHPPENLRQDLPCLSDFDFVYRVLKDVSDKLIELQPDKCRSFLVFFDQKDQNEGGEPAKDNAFTRYLRQMVGPKI